MPRVPGRRLAVLAVAAVAVASSAAYDVEPAAAATRSLTINMASTVGPVTHVGQGYLYGLNQDGTQPPDSLLGPLHTNLLRGGGAHLAGDGWIGDGYSAGTHFQARIDEVIADARRITSAPYSGRFVVMFNDLWGWDDTENTSTDKQPCDAGNCSNWISMIDTAIAKFQAAGVSVIYEPWNEPDYSHFMVGGSVNSTQYFQLWDSAVNEIHLKAPGAQIDGPAFSILNAAGIDNRAAFGAWLDHAKLNNTLPDIIAWHGLTDDENPVTDAATVNGLLSARSITGKELQINEYLSWNERAAGGSAWYLNQLISSGIGSAARGIWTDCCVSGTLDDSLGTNPASLVQTGQWWSYRTEGAMSGNYVSTTGSSSTTVAAAADQNRGRLVALLGDNAQWTGNVNLTVNGVPSWLNPSGTLHATVVRIPNTSPLSAPIPVLERDINPVSGSFTLPITWQASNDAYAVYVTAGPAQPATIDDATTTGTNHLTYSSGWSSATGIGDMYAGTVHWNAVTNATATLSFTGTGVILHLTRDVDQGIAAISVDGGTAVNVDDYSPVRNASGIAWVSPTLADTTHTVTIRVTGTKNPASSNTVVAIDRVDIAPTTVADDNTTTGPVSFNYSGTWGLGTGFSDLYQGTVHWSVTTGATATLYFTGSQIALHMVRDFDQGIAALSLDNGAPFNIDDYSATRNASGIVWTSPVLADAPHVLTIKVTGTKNPSSSNTVVAIDRADVTPIGIPRPVATSRIDNIVTSGPDRFSYDTTHGWYQDLNVADMYGRSTTSTNQAGGVATITFLGTQVALHMMRDIDQGIVSISLDGGTATNVDNYSPVRDATGIVWTSSTLADTTHTLTVTVTGTKNPASLNSYDAIDAIDVTAPTSELATTDATTLAGDTTTAYDLGNWTIATGIGDMYGNTVNYTFTTGATTTFTFTGSHIVVHMVRDVDQGIVAIAIDGGSPTNIDNYSSTRQATAVVWTSPVLATGPHVVTITDTGTKNPSSSNYGAAPDSVDVS